MGIDKEEDWSEVSCPVFFFGALEDCFYFIYTD